eukprot:scaffold30817_cov79-Isochrysis_galbana.AAC.1
MRTSNAGRRARVWVARVQLDWVHRNVRAPVSTAVRPALARPAAAAAAPAATTAAVLRRTLPAAATHGWWRPHTVAVGGRRGRRAGRLCVASLRQQAMQLVRPSAFLLVAPRCEVGREFCALHSAQSLVPVGRRVAHLERSAAGRRRVVVSSILCRHRDRPSHEEEI